MVADLEHGRSAHGLWQEQHPDEEVPASGLLCCWGATIYGPDRCTCWEPVYDVEQTVPAEPATRGGCIAADTLCGDCAFRPGSPERADEWSREHLYRLADTGEPFWCHRGMRRPLRYQHPDGRVASGSPDDWQPLTLNGVPYQADGTPGLLCAGWSKRNRRVKP